MTQAEATQLKNALDKLASGFVQSAPIQSYFKNWKVDVDANMNGNANAVTEVAGDAVVADLATTVALLNAIPNIGDEAVVTDATSPVVGSTVVGGGAVRVMVKYNGTNWVVE